MAKWLAVSSGATERTNNHLFMKHKALLVRLLLPIAILLLGLFPSLATTITWTNLSGNWSAATNWSPNQVPGSGDNAYITNNGIYKVTLDTTASVGTLSLGASSGQQTFSTGLNSLTLAGAGEINTNAVFNLNGGFVGGGAITVNGQFNWSAGQLGDAASTITVATNGLLVLEGVNGTDYSLGEFLTNAGTLRLQSGNLQINWDYEGALVNLPGGLINVTADAAIDVVNPGGPGFNNQGILRKSGGTRVTAINLVFSSSGTVDAQTGTISFPVGGTSTGVIQSEGGGAIYFSGGTFFLNGSLNCSNAILGGGTLSGGGTNSGVLTWTNGVLGVSQIGMTLATNGVLVLAGTNGADYSLGQFLTNAGTIKLESGNLQINWGAWGELINLPGALVNVMADVSIDTVGGGPGFINQGILRKSGGTGTTTINCIFSSSGTLDVQTGTVSVASGGSGTGNYIAEAGATLLFPASYEVDGVLSGAGTALFEGGTFTLDGSLTVANAVLGGGALSGTGTISDVLTWTNGAFGASSIGMTLATNGVLVLAGTNGADYSLGQYLTNAGTIELESGNLQINWGAWGEIINLPGALVNVMADVSIDALNGGPGFINQGILRKSAGTGTTAINSVFNNTGTLDVQTGTVGLEGGGSGNGNYIAEAGATLLFANSYEVDGVLSGAGTALLQGGTFTLNGNLAVSSAVLGGGTLSGSGTISTLLTWTNGAFGNNPIGMTLATNGVLILAATNGADYSLGQYLTNAGTIELQSGNLQINWGAWGVLVNLPGALVNVMADVSIDVNGGGPGFFNQGILRKSGGTGTTAINPALTMSSTGTLDAQTGTMNILNNGGTFNLAGGTMNFGINSLASFGQIKVTNTPALTLIGTVTANLNNGFVPVAGSSFSVLTYASETGVFTNMNLPLAVAWKTNYGSTVFSLNAQLALPTISPQSVNELATLSVTNSATDVNVPTETLTYGLVSAPAGMSINPGTGLITWVPAQTQSPSTNTVTVRVSDNGTPVLGATNSFTVTVVEVNVAPAFSTISSQSVNELALLTVTNAATESNIHATITGYGLIGPPVGMSINPATGVITWTPSQTQSPSTNTILTVVTNLDSLDLIHPVLTATNSITLVVKEVNVAPVLGSISGQTVNDLSLLTVTNAATDSNIHSSLSYSLLNPLAGMSISPAGVFSWTPSQNQGNSTNTITTAAASTDNFDLVNPLLSITNSFTVIVYAPTLAPVTNVTVNVGQTVMVKLAGSDNNASAKLHYGLVSGPASAALNASAGTLNWRPGVAFANTTNTIVVEVLDNSTPVLTATQSFNAIVNPLTPVTLGLPIPVGGQEQMHISGPLGPDYILQGSTTLTPGSWSNLLTNTPVSFPFVMNDPSAAAFSLRFYRIQLGP
jgi:hypothetical protein